MEPHLSKLLVRLSSSSRDASVLSDNMVKVDGKEDIAIVETLPADTNPWDEAHQVSSINPDFTFAEPEINSSAPFFAYEETVDERGDTGAVNHYSFIDYWPHPDKPSLWHLDDQHSQLGKARKEIAALQNKRVIRIAHLDTGYSSKHISNPGSLIRKDLQRNFVENESDRWNNAEDPLTTGTLKMPGHGAGTLTILAGARVSIPPCEFEDHIGLYEQVEIVPIRIAPSVVLLKSGAFVKALDYIVNELYPDPDKRVHVVTMSMGGVGSAAWADLVNLAYERGIFIVTAAGNNFNKLPARTMIFPARFRRVVAACGVTYDLTPYAKTRGDAGFRIMEGNYGPAALMDTAIAAFTPNVPWASYNNHDVVSIRGDGTSSATPQVAAAAALYYIKYYDELHALPEGWMRVEAIRHALFSTASKAINGHNGDYKKYFGNGVLQAAAALAVPVGSPETYRKQPADKVSFPFLKVIFGLRGLEDEPDREEEMLETELMQLVITDPELQLILQHEEKDLELLDPADQIRIARTVIVNANASDALKQKMQLIINQHKQNL